MRPLETAGGRRGSVHPMTPKKRRRARGEGSIYQRKDGLWVAAVPYYTAEGDRRYRRKYSKDYESAPQNLRDLQEESDHGIVGSSQTVSQWLEYWLEEIIRPDVKPNTYRDYSSVIRLYL